MPSNKNKIVDACIDFIDTKDCNYLAKEGQIVFYSSDTGRKSDFNWRHYSVAECLRHIKAIHLDFDLAKELQEGHLIAAFQEMGRVYEYGMKSRHDVREGLFNYLAQSGMNLGDDIARKVVEEVQALGLQGILLREARQAFAGAMHKLDLSVSIQTMNDHLYKHFDDAGYIIRQKTNRPVIEGRKQPVAMLEGAKPSSVYALRLKTVEDISKKIVKELK
jgi:hypothetical protein